MSHRKLSIRVDARNPDHHIWNNNGTWWFHCTFHTGNRKRRCRTSLKTRDVVEARRRRDVLIARAESLRAQELALDVERRRDDRNAGESLEVQAA